MNILSYHHIQEAVAEKKKKGRNMTSQERKWCVAEEQRRHELIRGLFIFLISYLFTFIAFNYLFFSGAGKELTSMMYVITHNTTSRYVQKFEFLCSFIFFTIY